VIQITDVQMEEIVNTIINFTAAANLKVNELVRFFKNFNQLPDLITSLFY